MDMIIDFYKDLDTINLILFWGIIIVIILLLTFSIILVIKNRKLKAMLEEQDNEHEYDKNDEIPVINETTINQYNIVKEDEETNDIPVIQSKDDDKEVNIINVVEKEPIVEIKEPVIEETNHFVAEEHVREYNQKDFVLPNIEKVREPEITEYRKEINEQPKLYQRNVLRDRYSNQTSPIGITKRGNDDINNVKDLDKSLHEEVKTNNYLDEVSKKINEAAGDINRTDYELRQEADAIISYDELMRKKDKLQIDEDEDAVISIDELISRSKQNQKLYNITEKEPNDEFISELKHFRHDL